MARKARLEVEGGLYHVITRGNDRQDIFHDHEDYLKFLSLLTIQKEKAGFFIYAYCLMTNHIHLLIERRGETVGRIMQRVLTGYSQWYNRRTGASATYFRADTRRSSATATHISPSLSDIFTSILSVQRWLCSPKTTPTALIANISVWCLRRSSMSIRCYAVLVIGARSPSNAFAITSPRESASSIRTG